MVCTVFFCLANFSQHDDFEIHPRCCTYQLFIPFNCWLVSHCVDIPQCVYPLIYLWTFGVFPVFAITNKAAMNIPVHVFVWDPIDQFVEVWGAILWIRREFFVIQTRRWTPGSWQVSHLSSLPDVFHISVIPFLECFSSIFFTLQNSRPLYITLSYLLLM